MYHTHVNSFLYIKFVLNSPNYSIRARLRFMNCTEQSGLTEYSVFVDSWRMYTVMSWINFIFIVSSCLEMVSTFNIHHTVHDGRPIRVLFNLTKSTFVNHRFGLSSTSSWQTSSSGEKRMLLFKNYLKNQQLLYIDVDY